MAKRSAMLVVFFGLALLLIMFWAGSPRSRTETGTLSFTFVGLTNDSTGALLARFKIANSFAREVSLGVNEVQVRGSNGWPNWIRNPGGSNWFSVAAESSLIVPVHTPTNQDGTWRVPLSWIEDQSVREEVRDKARVLINYAFSRVTRFSFQGFPPRRWSVKYGPELPCSSNELAQAAAAHIPVQSGRTPNTAQKREHEP